MLFELIWRDLNLAYCIVSETEIYRTTSGVHRKERSVNNNGCMQTLIVKYALAFIVLKIAGPSFRPPWLQENNKLLKDWPYILHRKSCCHWYWPKRICQSGWACPCCSDRVSDSPLPFCLLEAQSDGLLLVWHYSASKERCRLPLALHSHWLRGILIQ